MSVAYKDYYEILGVSKTATEQEIKSAYRKLAKKYHPDVNKTPGAEQKYKDVNEAYEVLHDPEKRQKYDTLGPNWEQAQQFGGQGGGFEGFSGFPGGGVHMDFGGSGSGFPISLRRCSATWADPAARAASTPATSSAEARGARHAVRTARCRSRSPWPMCWRRR